MSNRLIVTLYRSLFRVCHQFDKFPATKALLYRKSPIHLNSNSVFDDNDVQPIQGIEEGSVDIQVDPTKTYYDSVLRDAFEDDHSIFLTPSKRLYQKNSFQTFLREQFRNSDSTIPETNRVEAAFNFLRNLQSLWNHTKDFPDLLTTAENNYRNSEISNNKIFPVLTNSICPGVVLLSHPLIPGALNQSVVLVLEHNQKGTYGLIINKPLNETIKSAVLNIGNPDFLKTFGKFSIAFGGRERRMQCIHNVPDCNGIELPLCSAPIFSGGNIDKILEKFKDNNNELKIQFFIGCCVWDRFDLAKEIDSGCWIPIISQANEYLDLKTTDEVTQDNMNHITGSMANNRIENLWKSILMDVDKENLMLLDCFPKSIDINVDMIDSIDWK